MQLGLAASQYSFQSAWWPAKALPALGAALVTLEVRGIPNPVEHAMLFVCLSAELQLRVRLVARQRAAGARHRARHNRGAERSNEFAIAARTLDCLAWTSVARLEMRLNMHQKASDGVTLACLECAVG